jgi:hypothetical protein
MDAARALGDAGAVRALELILSRFEAVFLNRGARALAARRRSRAAVSELSRKKRLKANPLRVDAGIFPGDRRAQHVHPGGVERWLDWLRCRRGSRPWAARSVPRRWALAIWAFAIAARLLAVRGCSGGRPLVDDALMQHEMAVALSEGRLDTYWPPGVALYLTGVVELFGRSHDVSRLAMLPWSVAMLDVTRRLGVVLGREAGGRLALLLASLFPGFVLHGSVTLTHLPCAVCMGYAALLATELGTDRIERRVLATWALLGLVLGIGTLVRSSILAYAFGSRSWWPSPRSCGAAERTPGRGRSSRSP